MLATLLYACESWTVSKHDEKRLRALEMKSYRRLLGISWKEKKTNECKNQDWRNMLVSGRIEMVKRGSCTLSSCTWRRRNSKRVMEGGIVEEEDRKGTGLRI